MRFPEGFLESLADAPGFDKENFISAHERPAEISVRINPFKRTDKFDSCEPVPWCADAYYLQQRPEFIFDPLLHAGAYYVQEPSSMFLSHAIQSCVDLSEPQIILDLCAAPGGKSTLISSLIKNNCLLVSNEVIRPRASVLKENIIKWNSFNTVVTNNDPSHFGKLSELFDAMVIDAPCSGSGLFRKDQEAVKEWSEGNVMHCFARQKRILADALPSLKPGGFLFYSTCSYSKEENENISDWLMDEFGLENIKIPVKKEWGIVVSHSEKDNAEGYRFYPGKVKGEGFFLSVFRKEGNSEVGKYHQSKAFSPLTRDELAALNEFVLLSEDIIPVKEKDEIILIDKNFTGVISDLKKKLNVFSYGTLAGKMMREDLIPAHELAMSNFLNPALPFVEADLENAVRYLRKEDVHFPSSEKGWHLVKFENHVLGWIKSLGNRTNNYYPKEWRILKEFKRK